MNKIFSFFSSRCLVSDKSLRHVCFHVPHRWLRCMIPKKGKLTKTWKAAERRLSEFNQSSALMRKRKIRVASVTLRDAWIQMRGKRYYHFLILFYLSIRRLKKPSICLVEIGCRILNVLPFHHSAPLATEHADEEKDVETSCNTEEYENTGQSKMVWLCETLFYFSRKVD